jgi:hypothetical protein
MKLGDIFEIFHLTSKRYLSWIVKDNIVYPLL